MLNMLLSTPIILTLELYQLVSLLVIIVVIIKLIPY